MTNNTNQNTQLTPHAIFSAPKAIIFLHPPYGLESDKLRQGISISCKKGKLKILKIIQSKDSYDYRAFCKLVRRISTCHNKPVTVIIDDELLNTPVNTIMWAVFGTLLAAKLIIVVTYNKDGSDIILRKLTKYESRFLHQATAYFEKYYCFNWNKTMGRE